MYINNKNNEDLAVIFNNRLQTRVFEADNKKGYISRFLLDKNYKIKKTEKIFGEVRFIKVDELNFEYLNSNNIDIE